MQVRRKRGRSKDNGPRFLMLEHWLMKTEAWRSLTTVARCAYIEIKCRYAGPGSNNGRIPYSLLEMSQALNVSKATAMRALKLLRERGFLVIMRRGAFSVKTRMATEWRLTEHMCDATGKLPTKDFVHWRKKQNTVSPQHPNGYRDEPERVSC